MYISSEIQLGLLLFLFQYGIIPLSTFWRETYLQKNIKFLITILCYFTFRSSLLTDTVFCSLQKAEQASPHTQDCGANILAKKLSW